MIPPLSAGQEGRASVLTQLHRIHAEQDTGERDDCEADHREADNLLLALIDDPEISAAFRVIRKWYA